MAWTQRPEFTGELVRVVIDDAPQFPALTAAARLADQAAAGLGRLGYREQGTDLRGSGNSADVLDRLENWTPDWRRPLLLYWTGHGLLSVAGDLLLVCRDTPGVPVVGSTRLVRGRQLGELLAAKQVPQTILMIDACHCGGGVSEVVRGFTEAQKLLPSAVNKRLSLAVIGSAGHDEKAREGAFAQALADFVAGHGDWPATFRRYETISVSQLADALQQILEVTVGNVQTIAHDTHGLRAPVLLNPHFEPDLPDIPAELRGSAGAVIDSELAEHFLVKFRGIEVLGDRGWYFSGRAATLYAVSAWLAVPEPGMFVLTGPPGCGKSAVLGRLAVLSDARARRLAERAGALAGSQGPDIGEGALDVGLHIRGLTLAECVAGIARALDVQATDARSLCLAVAGLRRRHNRCPVIMVDALDEAKPADRLAIAADLLRPLAESGNAKVLVGVRREAPTDGDEAEQPRTVGPLPGLAPALQAATEADWVWRLDKDPGGDGDIADYIAQRLLDHPESPYAGLPERAADDGRKLAARCGRVFLPARASCQVLVHQRQIPDLDSADNVKLFSADVDRVFDADLKRFGADEGLVRDVLGPLAWAEGKGLPGQVWAPLIERLRTHGTHGRGPRVGAEDLPALIDKVAAYLIESGEDGQPVYRLYAEQFAVYLRSGADHAAVQTAVTECLLGLVESAGSRDWASANPYIRRHLSAHAAAAGLLRELVEDPAYLAFADPDLLRAVLRGVDLLREPYARLYGRVAHHMRGLNPLERSELLQESAIRDEPALLPGLAVLPDLVWRGLGSTAPPTPFHLVLKGNTEVPRLVGFAGAGPRTVVVGYDGATVHAWDPANGERLQTLGRVRSTAALAALGTLDRPAQGGTPGRIAAPVLATCVPGEIRFLDVLTREQARPPLRVGSQVSAIGFAEADGRRPLVVAGPRDVSLIDPDGGEVLRRFDIDQVHCVASAGNAALATADRTGITVWNPESGERLHRIETRTAVHTLAIGTDEDGLLLAYDAPDLSVRVWHESRGETSLLGHTRAVTCVALARTGADAVLVSGAEDGTARLWDPVRGTSVLLQERAGSIGAVALVEREGRLLLATGGGHRDIRVWDPPPWPLGEAAGRVPGDPTPDPVRSVAFATGSQEPVAIVGTAGGLLEVRATTGQLRRGWRLPGRVVSIASHGSYAAAGLTGGLLARFRWGEDEEPDVFVAHGGAVGALAYTHDGVLVSGGADGLVKFWPAEAPAERPSTLRLDSDIRALSCWAGSAEPLLACATASGTTVFRLPGREIAREVPQPGSAQPSACALGALGADGADPVLAVGDSAGGLRLYALPSGELLQVLDGHAQAVHRVAVGRVGDRDLVVSAADRTVRLWDPGSGGCLDIWTERVKWLRAAAFRFDDGRLLRALAMGGATHFARLDRVPGGRGRVG